MIHYTIVFLCLASLNIFGSNASNDLTTFQSMGAGAGATSTNSNESVNPTVTITEPDPFENITFNPTDNTNHSGNPHKVNIFKRLQTARKSLSDFMERSRRASVAVSTSHSLENSAHGSGELPNPHDLFTSEETNIQAASRASNNTQAAAIATFITEQATSGSPETTSGKK